MAYNIFLSYRRQGGYETAKHLYDLLVYDGYTVSFDIDTLRSGDFDNELLRRIDECTDFIIILNKGVFDRCLDPSVDKKQDWLRNELAYAIEKKKNIVPIMLDGFKSFPENLPVDIADVARKNSPKYDQYYFDDFYRRLKETFLETPSPTPVAKKKTKMKIAVWIVLGVLLLSSVFLFVWKMNNNNESLPFITPLSSDAPANIMQSLKVGMPMKYVEEHFGTPEGGVWEFKNLTFGVGKEEAGNIISSLEFHSKGNINLPWDNVIAQYKIPNFGIATFGDILDKLNYDGKNVTWIGSLEFNPCIANWDFGSGGTALCPDNYVKLTIGPSKSTNFKTYILSADWVMMNNEFSEKLGESSDENGRKDFSALTNKEFNQVLEMIRKLTITSLTIK